jgi:hypothetical protein
MSHEVEERLAASMREHVAGIKLDGGVLARAGKRHRRRKVLWRGAVGAVVLASVAMVGAAAMLNGTGAGEGLNPAVYQDVDTSQARFVAAVTASEGTSYQVTITTRFEKAPGKVVVTTGAYDPATNSGYLRTGTVEERLVDGVLYILRQGTTYAVPKPKISGLLYEFPGEKGFFGTSVDPQVLLEAMRQRGVKITETGRGVFHVEMTRERGEPRTTITISGDVLVGADNRVAKVNYTTVMSGAQNYEATTEMVFSNYGAPVRVEKP